jgi:phosphoribosyl-ATP pyrophosphohydrolase/phosphoribosyl-AMP cyclohydrolase
MKIDEMNFDERGLVPTIVQDARTREVLMLAYMNAESLRRTLEAGETWFWSRSRRELWHKGATSGHVQKVARVRVDCDTDALLVEVEPAGAACHTGARSCFYREIEMRKNENEFEAAKLDAAASDKELDSEKSKDDEESKNDETLSAEEKSLGATLESLYKLIEQRRRERPADSYTSYLFEAGLDKILKKIGEESAETIIAAKNDNEENLIGETADLLYHLTVLLVERGVSLEDVRAELEKRRGKQAKKK